MADIKEQEQEQEQEEKEDILHTTGGLSRLNISAIPHLEDLDDIAASFYDLNEFKVRFNFVNEIRETTMLFTQLNLFFSIVYFLQKYMNISVFCWLTDLTSLLNFSTIFATTIFLILTFIYLNFFDHGINSWKYQFCALIVYLYLFTIIIAHIKKSTVSTNTSELNEQKNKINIIILVFSAALFFILFFLAKYNDFAMWLLLGEKYIILNEIAHVDLQMEKK